MAGLGGKDIVAAGAAQALDDVGQAVGHLLELGAHAGPGDAPYRRQVDADPLEAHDRQRADGAPPGLTRRAGLGDRLGRRRLPGYRGGRQFIGLNPRILTSIVVAALVGIVAGARARDVRVRHGSHRRRPPGPARGRPDPLHDPPIPGTGAGLCVASWNPWRPSPVSSKPTGSAPPTRSERAPSSSRRCGSRYRCGRRWRGRPADQLVARGRSLAGVVAGHGDAILYRSKGHAPRRHPDGNGGTITMDRVPSTAEAFNALAEGVAILSLLAGHGIELFGVHIHDGFLYDRRACCRDFACRIMDRSPTVDRGRHT